MDERKSRPPGIDVFAHTDYTPLSRNRDTDKRPLSGPELYSARCELNTDEAPTETMCGHER